jgi:Tol biopolymer transport system component
MSKKGGALCLAAFLICIAISGCAQKKSANRVVSERLVAQIGFSSSEHLKSCKVSPDGRRVACVARRCFYTTDKWFVVDRGEGRQSDTIRILYDGITEGTPIFSPDSKRIAYGVQAGNKQFVVVDGKKGEPYDGILESTLIFSPDSKRVACVAQVGDKWFLVVDSEEGKQYDSIAKGALSFSPDSKRVAYVAQAGDKQFVVVDREEGKQYDAIPEGRIIFDSPDSFHYLAIKGNNIYLVEERVK